MFGECLLIDLVENRLLWIDSHLFALLSWHLMTGPEIGPEIVVDEFHGHDEGLSGIAVFEVTLLASSSLLPFFDLV